MVPKLDGGQMEDAEREATGEFLKLGIPRQFRTKDGLPAARAHEGLCGMQVPFERQDEAEAPGPAQGSYGRGDGGGQVGGGREGAEAEVHRGGFEGRGAKV